MRRRTKRWETHFGRWISDFGASRLTQALRSAGEPVDPTTVYRWVSGTSSPRPPVAKALVRLSAGELTLESIYEHRELARSIEERRA